jgi:cytoskeletal protein RodZ
MSQLQNKLLNYEVQPPEGVWNKIAASLDETVSVSLSEKLYHYKEEPSSKVWDKINTRLDRVKEQSKVIPLFVKYRRPLKYSGAVAIFIFLAIMTSLLISKKTESELPEHNAVSSSTVLKKDTSKTDSKETNSTTANTEKNNSENSIAKSKISRTGSGSNQNSFSFAENFLPKQAERNETVSSSLSSDKYMIYSDDDGNAIRLPKKIFNAFACPTDDLACKQKLQKLREKFAESAMTADFTGVLQILKSLQENQ